MAIVGATYLSMADNIKRRDPNNKIARIVELLTPTNEILEDMVVIEGNTQVGHRTTMRSGLPTVSFKKIYGYTAPSKSTVIQVDDTAAIIEGFSFVDQNQAEIGGDIAGLRLSEDAPFFEAMNQKMLTAYFYGNTATDPEEFLGLSPRFNVLSTTPGNSGTQIIDGGGTGSNNTSMWLLKHGEQYLHSFFPKGTKMGLDHQDMGLITETNSDGAKRVGYQSQFRWKIGISVRDYRHIVRIANLDVPDLNTVGSSSDSSPDLTKLMVDALNLKMQNLQGGKLSFYCGREVYTALTNQTLNKLNVALTYEKPAGSGPVLSFQGVPIKRVDALLKTESRVV